MASLAHGHGFPVVDFICPQLWAWAPWRARRFAKVVDLGLTILPFEQDYFGRLGIEARFIGHPTAEQVARERAAPPSPLAREIATCECPIALLPGSRGQEIRTILPLQAKIVRGLLEHFPRARFFLPQTKERAAGLCREFLAQHRDLPITVVDDVPSVLRSVRFALVASGTATFEVAWDLEFANPTGFPEEATGTILLPAGAVASGLTLWVDGQPRDAVFSTREATSDAYRTIVRQQRDPALLVTSGIRRVNLSCFPVPPNGTMRLRIACIATLAPRPDGVADIGAPCFEGGNFGVAPHGVAPLRHAVDVVGLHGISAAHEVLRVAAPDRVSGTMTQAELASSPVVATVVVPEPSRETTMVR
ncbi:hypothetical protein HUU42_04965 [bacterium]|nr:hypothetical protein [bacterium]